MKVELTAISKQAIHPPTAQGGVPPTELGDYVVMAQFSPVDGSELPPYGPGAFVPYECVAGAQVGDLFTLHLERVQK